MIFIILVGNFNEFAMNFNLSILALNSYYYFATEESPARTGTFLKVLPEILQLFSQYVIYDKSAFCHWCDVT